MQINHNVVGWFEIPVTDMDRAVNFYQAILGYKLERQRMGELEMAWFPMVPDTIGSGGSLVCHKDFYHPSQDGVIIYLTAFSGDLSNELSRVEANGGKVIMHKKQISPDHGFMAVFLDSEGNRIALHSRA